MNGFDAYLLTLANGGELTRLRVIRSHILAKSSSRACGGLLSDRSKTQIPREGRGKRPEKTKNSMVFSWEGTASAVAPPKGVERFGRWRKDEQL